MRRSTTFVASTAGALAALLTAGCSGEPSDADITQALASAYKGVGLSDKHLLGLKAEKLGCEKEGKGYMLAPTED